MGRYFGIGNSTKNQSVSSYWKGDEWCNCYQVMHQLHWNKTDSIYSCCYDTICEFNYDIESGELNAVDVTEQRMNEQYENDNNENEDKNEDKDEDDEEKNKNDNNKPKVPNEKYGFDENLDMDKLNHVPEWDGNRCVKCDYHYDEILLEKYKKKFDGCFFMG